MASASRFRKSKKARITLADGRQLPLRYNTFTHGYAVTSHSSTPANLSSSALNRAKTSQVNRRTN